MAEQTCLIVPLGYWVLEEACRQLAAWDTGDHPHPTLRLSVNLSPRQLRQPELPDRVAQILARSGLEPRRLTPEVTETSITDDPVKAGATLAALRQLGVQVAVDDFGTGFSALGALKHYSVDALKIDRSFVDGLGRDAQDTAIVHAVIAFTKTLGLRVIRRGHRDPRTGRAAAGAGLRPRAGLLVRQAAPAQRRPAVPCGLRPKFPERAMASGLRWS